MTPRARIDVHQHLVPPEYARWLAGKGATDAGGRALPDWDIGSALELMDRHDRQRQHGSQGNVVEQARPSGHEVIDAVRNGAHHWGIGRYRRNATPTPAAS